MMALSLRLAVGAALTAVLVTTGGIPASAHEEVGAHGSIAVSPGGDVDTPPTMTGRFEVSALETVDGVVLTVAPSGPTRGNGGSANGCSLATAGKCGEAKVAFSWSIPALAYNGPYVVNATAKHCLSLCVNPPTTARVSPVAFRLAQPPRRPEGLKADIGDNGSVVVSWTRNSEPDIIGYALFRKGPGDSAFKQVGNPIPQPVGATGRGTYTDVAAAGGGTFSYQVAAVRNGASGDSSTAIASTPSTPVAANVPVPTPETTIAPSTVPGGAAAGPTTTVAAKKASPPGAGSVNLGGFLKPGTAPPSTPVPTLPEIDNGFNSELPFGLDEVEPGEEQLGEEAAPAGSRGLEDEATGRGPLVPVAVGTIMLVLAMHVRLLNRRLASPDPAIAMAAAGAGGLAVQRSDDPYAAYGDEPVEDDSEAVVRRAEPDAHSADLRPWDGDGDFADSDWQPEPSAVIPAEPAAAAAPVDWSQTEWDDDDLAPVQAADAEVPIDDEPLDAAAPIEDEPLDAEMPIGGDVPAYETPEHEVTADESSTGQSAGSVDPAAVAPPVPPPPVAPARRRAGRRAPRAQQPRPKRSVPQTAPPKVSRWRAARTRPSPPPPPPLPEPVVVVLEQPTWDDPAAAPELAKGEWADANSNSGWSSIDEDDVAPDDERGPALSPPAGEWLSADDNGGLPDWPRSDDGPGWPESPDARDLRGAPKWPDASGDQSQEEQDTPWDTDSAWEDAVWEVVTPSR